jgi:hypothetical protein
LVGNFKNQGVSWEQKPHRVKDHDFRSDAEGMAIPYGIYDTQANRGFVVVGTSHETLGLNLLGLEDRKAAWPRVRRRHPPALLAGHERSGGARQAAPTTIISAELSRYLFTSEKQRVRCC